MIIWENNLTNEGNSELISKKFDNDNDKKDY
jgi:hypothetical protein